MTAPGPAPPRPRWALSATSFERLLLALDPDRDRAGQRYEVIRRKLARLFEWRGCARPEDLADATIDRVARRLDEGADLHAADVYSFFHGVALRVAQEHWRTAGREQPLPERLPEPGPPPAAAETEAAAHEGDLACLDGCLAGLPPEHRRLLERYHASEARARIDGRKALAREMGLSPVALRLRAYRLRTALAACIEGCRRRKAAETQRQPAP